MTEFSSIPASWWFQTLEPSSRRLFKLSIDLLQREKRLQSNYPDYSFIIFSASKAYEGFLKQFLLREGLITEPIYRGKRFRIGRSLNPDISKNQRDEWWLYDDIVRKCGEEMAKNIWQVWVESRNHVFHYFPTRENNLSLQQVEHKMRKLFTTIEQALRCVS